MYLLYALRSIAMSLIEAISFGQQQILRVLHESSGEPINDPDLHISDEEMEEMSRNLDQGIAKAAANGGGANARRVPCSPWFIFEC